MTSPKDEVQIEPLPSGGFPSGFGEILEGAKDNIGFKKIGLAVPEIWTEMPLMDRSVRSHEKWSWHVVRVPNAVDGAV